MLSAPRLLGLLCMLEPLVTSETAIQYTYQQSDTNLDFIPGSANLTPYNARVEVKKGVNRRALLAAEVQPYANLRGLFVLSPDLMSSISDVQAVLKNSMDICAPEYD